MDDKTMDRIFNLTSAKLQKLIEEMLEEIKDENEEEKFNQQQIMIVSLLHGNFALIRRTCPKQTELLLEQFIIAAKETSKREIENETIK
jgi:hypothetical protein